MTHTNDGLTDADRADLAARLTSWFGDDRQAFLVSHLAPVVDRIKADAYSAGLAAKNTELCDRIAALTPMVLDEYPLTGEWLNRHDVLAVLAWHIPDCNCPPPYADCPHPPCDCATCVERGSDLCENHHWFWRPESDTRECLICGTEVAG